MSTPKTVVEWTKWSDVTEDVKIMGEKLKPEAEEREHMTFTEFISLAYRRLPLCGATHYEIKVYVGNDLCLFLKCCQVLIEGPPPSPELDRTALLPLPSIIYIHPFE